MYPTDLIADRKIKEAQEEGAFDNLPGKGLPLSLEDDASIPPHLRAASRILRNAGIRPDWVQVHVEIHAARAECERIWRQVEAEYPRRRENARSADRDSGRARRLFAEWHARSRSAYLRAIKSVNSDILKFNLMAPASPGVQIPFRIAEETERFDRAFPAPSPLTETREADSDRSPHRLRAAAAARYRASSRKDEPSP